MSERDDMPAPPEPFVKPLAANGLASKPGLYTVGQLVRYAQQYAEQRVREERAEDERLLREAMESLLHVTDCQNRSPTDGQVRMIDIYNPEHVDAAIAALRKRLGE